MPQDPGELNLYPPVETPRPETAPGVLAPTVTLTASLQAMEAIRLLLEKSQTTMAAWPTSTATPADWKTAAAGRFLFLKPRGNTHAIGDGFRRDACQQRAPVVETELAHRQHRDQEHHCRDHGYNPQLTF